MKNRTIPLLIAVAAGAALSAAAAEPADSASLSEVVVTGTRSVTDTRHLPMTVTVIGRDRLTASHEQSVLPTVMQQVPGLFVTSRAMMGYGMSTGGSGNISLRGLSGGSGQLLVLIDGHPQYSGIYGHPIADSYQTMLAERVEVLRGPASALYGSNAMGGVMNIVTRKMAHDGTRASATLSGGSYGTAEAEATVQTKAGAFSSTVSAQYGRTDNHRPHMGFEQYGGYVKLGYDISPHWNARADADVTHFNAQYPGRVQSPVYGACQWITRGAASAAVENSYRNTSGAVSVYSNFGRHKIDDGTQDPALSTNRYFRSKDALTGVSVYQSAQLFAGNRVTVGADYRHIYGHAYYTSKETGEVMDTPNKQSGRSHRNEIAVYADFRQDLLPWLTVDAGIRADHHSVTGTEWVPQAGLVVRPVTTGELKLVAAKGFRNPTMRELYLYPPSNEELRPERLWNCELAWQQRTGRLSYGANLYCIKGDNMIQTVDRRNTNTGAIENRGAEAELAFTLGRHWSVTTNHSWLHMKNKVVAAPEYKGFAGADYRSDRLRASATLQYIANLYTAVGSNATKESFCLLGLAVSYAAAPHLTVWARGENLLAQDYEINQGYPMPRATVMAGIRLDF